MPLIKETHIALTALPVIQEICAPLTELLGITGFCYHKVFKDGRELLFSNNEAWVRRVFTKNITIGMEYVTPLKNQPLQFNAFLLPLDNTIECLREVRATCQWNYGISLSNHNNEYFGFSVLNHSDAGIMNHLMNHRDLLERFCLYFTEKTSALIQKAEKDIVLNNPQGALKLFSEQQLLIPSKEDFHKHTPLKKIPFTSVYGDAVHLTRRETDCLQGLIRGATAQEIAKKLQLAERTIEMHLDNLKRKFNVSRKSELLRIIFENGWQKYFY